MPVFEYKCSKCEHHFEELVFKSTDKPNCPICDSAEVDKMVSTFASNAFKGEPSANCSSGSCGKKHSFG